MQKILRKFQLNTLEISLIAFILLVHLFVANYIGLSPDEAHYALYAKYLDWSYYDHPPMVGWVQYVFLKLSTSNLSLRIIPMASWLLTLFLLLKIEESVKQDANIKNVENYHSIKIRFVITAYALSPMMFLLSVALVPDTLLMPILLVLMLLTWNLLQFDNYAESAWKSWIYLGLILGCAGLTKYTSVFFVFPVGILLIKKYGISLLFKLKIWISALIALILITPVLFWNYQHDWTSFTYQLNHASGSNEWSLKKCIVFTIVVIISYGPMVFFGFSSASKKNILRDKSTYFYLIFSIPFLLLLVFLSGRGSTLPHWVAPAIVALLPLSSAQLLQFSPGFNKIYKGLVIFQLICTLILVIFLVHGGLGEEVDEQKNATYTSNTNYAKNNPFADLFGWELAGENAKRLMGKYKIKKMVVSNWTLASRIAWYSNPFPVNVIDRRQDQFEIWFGALQEGETALWIDWSMMPFNAPIGKNQFRTCEIVDQLPVFLWGRQISHFNFAICEGWQFEKK